MMPLLKMKTRVLYPIVILLSSLHCAVKADSIVLTNDQVLNGTIIQKNDKQIVVRVDYSVLRFPLHVIKSVNGQAPATAATESTKLNPVGNRFPRWSDVVTALGRQPWATNLQQIPATVIDKGVMRNVPYLSFRCGIDYELNIYGDPDDPASVEIGIYRSLLGNESAKQNCINFINSILPDNQGRTALQQLDRRRALYEKDGLTLEITPETAEDAYGGWWVSAYKEKALNGARASDAEVESISVPRRVRSKASNSNDLYAWSGDDMRLTRGARLDDASAFQAYPPATPTPTPPRYSKPPAVGASSGGDRVYVRGYYRKDGTYVQPYTRSR
jgi:hypothetical protein